MYVKTTPIRLGDILDVGGLRVVVMAFEAGSLDDPVIVTTMHYEQWVKENTYEGKMGASEGVSSLRGIDAGSSDEHRHGSDQDSDDQSTRNSFCTSDPKSCPTPEVCGPLGCQRIPGA